MDVLAIGETFSSEDWNTIELLLAASLEAGVGNSQYSELLECLYTVWAGRGSISYLDRALDLLESLESLTRNAIQDVVALERFFGSVLARFTSGSRKIRTDQWEMLRLLSADLGVSDSYESIRPDLQDVPPGDPGIDLSGKFIAIYTLTESAGARAKAVVEKMFRSADVRVSNDYGGTDKLKGLARNSDYCIVSTRSAKHAATEFIKANRPKKGQI